MVKWCGTDRIADAKYGTSVFLRRKIAFTDASRLFFVTTIFVRYNQVKLSLVGSRHLNPLSQRTGNGREKSGPSGPLFVFSAKPYVVDKVGGWPPRQAHGADLESPSFGRRRRRLRMKLENDGTGWCGN
jgi:hypothetical protein